jgi:hypothetical protein
MKEQHVIKHYKKAVCIHNYGTGGWTVYNGYHGSALSGGTGTSYLKAWLGAYNAL